MFEVKFFRQSDGSSPVARKHPESIIKFAHKHKLFLMADEVYQVILLLTLQLFNCKSAGKWRRKGTIHANLSDQK